MASRNLKSVQKIYNYRKSLVLVVSFATCRLVVPFLNFYLQQTHEKPGLDPGMHAISMQFSEGRSFISVSH